MDISIIIPYYNTGSYLPDALQSVSAFYAPPGIYLRNYNCG